MRAPLLLLMAAASLAATPLERLNPWLSACDLEEEGAAAARACGRAACLARSPLAAHEARGLCAGGSGEAEVKQRFQRVRERRLRTCCERSPLSALDARGRLELAGGGARCERVILDLVDLDAMAARVHCAFVDILQRYDCQQSYSVHTCDECQETYRRWACSTLVPFFVTKEQLEMEDGKGSSSGDRGGSGKSSGGEGGRARRAPPEPPPPTVLERRERPERRGTSAHSEAGAKREPPTHTDPEGGRWRARHLERVGHLDRRRFGGGVVGRWVRAAAAGPGRPATDSPYLRLKPCLAVCQLVEQHCPYFLPGDRAPAYPTQYAGEPTFLCLDPRIPETGEQEEHSNYGTDECCYWHCGADELCYRCDTAYRIYEDEPQVRDTCIPVEERVSTCVLPYNAPAPPAPALSSATRARLSSAPALLAAVALLCALPSLTALARHTRTDRTLFLITNVHGARL